MKNFDKALLFAVAGIFIIGLMALYSASREYHSPEIIFRQLIWIFFGIILSLVIIRIDCHKFINAAYLLYGITLALLVLVLFSGRTRGGAHRWIGLGMFNLQPSELAKITIVFALASYLGKRKNEITKISVFLGGFALVLPVCALILVEPDLGTAFLLIPVAFVMFFIAGAEIKHLIGAALAGLGAFPFFWHFLKDYQKQRLFVFINPNVDPLGSGYTIIQSKIAVGSGGFFGKGWLSGTQNQLNFLPERHTDFIFSVIGEEWGFLGALFLILCYIFIVYRGIKTTSSASNIYGRLIAAGFVTVFSLQVIINIGMTIGFLPIVGLTLPLISYGGSSLITTLVYLSILLNIEMHR